MDYLKLVLLTVVCLMASACTAARQQASTIDASTEWRLKSLEESFLNFREEQRLQADRSLESSEAVSRKLENLEQKIASLKSGSSIMAAPEDVSADSSSVEKGWVTDLKPEDDGWVEGQKNEVSDTVKTTIQNDETQPWDTVPGPPPVVPEPKIVERKKTSVQRHKASPELSSAKALYTSGLAKYNGDDFIGARSAFEQFVKKYPKNDLVPNALYWKGETFYSQKDFAQSILAFKEVTGRYPKHDKSAAALLKIGMSYDKVGDPDNAIFYLRALIEDFPKSAPAKLARQELNRLGG
ncbi:tol-pal system protein YbgF [Pseudodesulfovibrio piezophilus]|uniref:Tol-pal system protein YbgF n=1 Tax=Pseudodesulfovibrio piezophilus (strain DSM 21447 / JCM 15486 / C1TLV30) TaxID=1322246 RepID=M1WJI8_PSEP2|nr:tol-pal system protein YbgF [Pseudodesulfovibrio piezophilus]CCH47971.1 Tol-pal system protein YbgF [Pseudodesulfovibrio piezophilus C1TLV30]